MITKKWIHLFFLTADYNEINFKKASQEQWVLQL